MIYTLRRTRGRGRRDIGSFFAVIGLLILAMLVAGCHRQEPSAPESTGTSGIDSATLLHANELGPGWHESSAEQGQPRWPWEQGDCPAYRGEDYRAQAHRRDAIQRFYQTNKPSLTAHQVVELYEPGWGERVLDDVRRVLRQCPTYTLLGAKISLTVVDAANLRDAPLLVRGQIEHAASPPTVSYFVTVRRGDTVSTLKIPDLGSQALVEAAAARQAAHLG